MALTPTTFDPTQANISSILGQTMFCVPTFQRKYSWETEYVGQLWDDIIDFYREHKAQDSERYFLGPIVTYYDNETFQIIDGQQRITTLKILLKILYERTNEGWYNRKKMLTNANNSQNPDKECEDVLKIIHDLTNCRSAIELCLWHKEENDGINWLLVSKVNIDDENNKLQEVLNNEKWNEEDYYLNGKMKKKYEKGNNVHLRNWIYLNKKVDQDFRDPEKFAAVDHQKTLLQIINYILNKCELLSINCTSRDAALRIFNTLNSRGMQLADSDIIKADIVKTLDADTESQNKFEKVWAKFDCLARNYAWLAKGPVGNDSECNGMFRKYMHIRLSKTQFKTADPGLYRYFSKELKNEVNISLFDNLLPLTEFWVCASRLFPYKNIDSDYIIEPESIEKYIPGDQCKKMLHVLSCIQNNPYWQYLISNYLWRFCIDTKQSINEEHFANFLAFVVAYSLRIYFGSQQDLKTVYYRKRYDLHNASEHDVMSSEWWFSSTNDSTQELSSSEDNLRKPILDAASSHSTNDVQYSKALLALHAYLNFDQKLCPNGFFEIEHIFPQAAAKDVEKNQTLKNQYGMLNNSEISSCLESFGNKLAIEKPINCSASDHKFNFKQCIYRGEETIRGRNKEQSQFIEAIKLSKLDEVRYWGKDQIKAREEDFIDKILTFIKDPLHDFSTWPLLADKIPKTMNQ